MSVLSPIETSGAATELETLISNRLTVSKDKKKEICFHNTEELLS